MILIRLFLLGATIICHSLHAMENQNSNNFCLEKQYNIISGLYAGKKAQLKQETTPTFFDLKNNREIHNILMQRIKSSQQAKEISQLLTAHRKDGTLKEMFDALPYYIKDIPVYLALIENEEHYIDQQHLEKD
jgi:hypothetical protein